MKKITKKEYDTRHEYNTEFNYSDDRNKQKYILDF